MLRLESFLPYRLSVLTNRVSRVLARLYAERYELSIAQWRVLAVLGEASARCADDICRITEMDKVTVSRAVHALVAQGRVERRVDGRDRRRARLELSDAGRAVYRQLAPLVLEIEARLLGALDPDERRVLDNLLVRLDERSLVLEGDAGDGGTDADDGRPRKAMSR